MTIKKNTKASGAEPAGKKTASASCRKDCKKVSTAEKSAEKKKIVPAGTESAKAKNTGIKPAGKPAKKVAVKPAAKVAVKPTAASRGRDIYTELPTGSKLTVTVKEADEFLSVNFSLFLKECVHHKFLEDRNSIRSAVGLCVLAWNLSIIRGNRNLKKSAADHRAHFVNDEEFSETVKVLGREFNPVLELFIEEKNQKFSKFHDLILAWDFDLGTEISNFLIPFKMRGCAAEEAKLPDNAKELF